MLKFILKRTCWAVVTLFVIITATFFLLNAAPGDPIAAKCKQMPENARLIMEKKYGLDQPVYKRYVIYMNNLLKGDLGTSIVYPGVQIKDIITQKAPTSAKLGGIALVFQLIIGISLGLIAGLKKDKLPDYLIRVLVVLAICIPGFVFMTLLQYLLGFKLKVLPAFGWGKPINYVLPVLVFVVTGIAGYTKYTRSSTIAVLNEDYIVTAKAKGCNEGRTVRKHVLRNAMIPMVTIIPPAIAGIFVGAFITEATFGIPGIGSYFIKAVTDNDYTMILGLSTFFTALYLVSLIAVDILYGIVDPRIRIVKGAK